MIEPIVFTVLTAFSCPKTDVVNKTTEWNKQDQIALETAKNRCGQLFLNAPCLKMFRKVEEGIYTALCGAGKDANG
jgi:hypothetical protein